MFDVIICDPDENKFEGQFLGLLYTAVSRATTLGDDDGLNSAIYFTGNNFTAERIRCIGKKKNSQDNFLNVTRRSIWVSHLKLHTKENNMSDEYKKQLFHWAEHTKITYNQLYLHTRKYLNHSTTETTTRKRKLH